MAFPLILLINSCLPFLLNLCRLEMFELVCSLMLSSPLCCLSLFVLHIQDCTVYETENKILHVVSSALFFIQIGFFITVVFFTIDHARF